MARIRSIHPGQWTDETFVSCSPFARLLAIAVRNEADDQGIFEWKPVTLKMRLFPADSVDIDALLGELMEHEQVYRYEVAGKPYGIIRNFTKYQRPKTPNSLYPQPPSSVPSAFLEGVNSEIASPKDPPISETTGAKGGSSSEISAANDAPNTEMQAANGEPFPQKGEMEGAQAGPFPQNAEIAPQRKEEGGRREKKENIYGRFDEFWEAYPSRGGHANPKHPARQAWGAAIKSGTDPGDIVAAARRYAESVSGEEPRHVCQARTWLHQQRWRDYLGNGADRLSVEEGRLKVYRETGTWLPNWGDRREAERRTSKDDRPPEKPPDEGGGADPEDPLAIPEFLQRSPGQAEAGGT